MSAMDIMMDIYSRCRLCAGVHTLGINIFGDEGRKMEVKQKIRTYLSLEVEKEDTLPKNICYLCLGRIEEFHKFKTMCYETQLTLKNWTYCFDDEDMSYYSERNFTSGSDDKEDDEHFCTSLLNTDIGNNAAVENHGKVKRRHGKLGKMHKSSAKSTEKTLQVNSGESKKVNTITEQPNDSNSASSRGQSSNDELMSRLPSQTLNALEGLCSSTFTKYNSSPSRRKHESQRKKGTIKLTMQQEDLGTTSDDAEGEEGFTGFIAERNRCVAEFECKPEPDSAPSSENEMPIEYSGNTEGRVQNEWNASNAVSFQDDNNMLHCNQINSAAEIIRPVKQEQDEPSVGYECKMCCKTFTRKSYLKEHLKVHTGEKPYICPSCGKPFRNNYMLKIHMNLHTGEKRYKCHECNIEFVDRNAFIEHSHNHCEVKSYTHKSSQMRFLQKTSMMHEKIQRKQKMYSCEYCKASFLDKSSCLDHMRCHTGEKPYSCDLCDRRFTQQSNLVAHLKVHRDEPFTCRLCKSSFSSKAQLTRHLSSAHRDVMLEVVNEANPGSNASL